MLTQKKLKLPADQRRLLDHYARLDPEQQRMLLAFAEFLATRRMAEEEAAGAPAKAVAESPLEIPRPRKESVVGAIKRLAQTYPMLDRSELLDETSALMSAHIMQGREAAAVIDDLETLFRTHYESHAADRE